MRIEYNDTYKALSTVQNRIHSVLCNIATINPRAAQKPAIGIIFVSALLLNKTKILSGITRLIIIRIIKITYVYLHT